MKKQLTLIGILLLACANSFGTLVIYKFKEVSTTTAGGSQKTYRLAGKSFTDSVLSTRTVAVVTLRIAGRRFYTIDDGPGYKRFRAAGPTGWTDIAVRNFASTNNGIVRQTYERSTGRESFLQVSSSSTIPGPRLLSSTLSILSGEAENTSYTLATIKATFDQPTTIQSNDNAYPINSAVSHYISELSNKGYQPLPQ